MKSSTRSIRVMKKANWLKVGKRANGLQKESKQSFSTWLAFHGCDKKTLWYLQNMIGSCLGFDHPLHLEAKKAWEDTDDPK